MSFVSLNLTPVLVANLQTLGFDKPTQVQSQAIPEILAGRDLMAGARTGSGKTAAYALPLMHMLLSSPAGTPKLRSLILVPTRELAQQVYNNLLSYSQNTGLKSSLVYGGAPFESQQKALAAGVDILVTTPGRLLDHLRKGTLSLANNRFLVLDEADRMLDMGFRDEIRGILRQLPKSRQTLLFSATFDDHIFRFSKSLLSNPILLEVDKRNSGNQDIEQQVYEVDDDRKTALLCHLLTHKAWPQVLIFSRTRQSADTLAKVLADKSIKPKPFMAICPRKAAIPCWQSSKIASCRR